MKVLRFIAPAAVLAVAACNSGGGGSYAVPGSPSQGSSVTQQSQARTQSPGGLTYRAACPGLRQGRAQCDVLYAAGVRPNAPSGHGATDLESAYNLPSSGGSGQVVAAVDAYDNPNAASDLAAYDAEYGLPSAKFTKYNQNGQQSNYPQGNTGWGLEEDLDIQMLSAGCNGCTIYLIEANSNSWSDLEAGVAEAAKLGATVVSNSYGGSGGTQSDYNIPGVTILASAGDGGYGTQDPADFPSVVAVGGTVLTKGGGSRGWTETVWSGTGSGCSSSADKKPKWQKAKWTPGCSNRVMNDVAAVGTGVAMYDTYGYSGWVTVAGTSISSPLVGSVFGLAGNSTTQDGGKTFWEKKHHQYLFDVTSGSNGSCTPAYLCTGEVGYDGPTGWGTPNGTGAF